MKRRGVMKKEVGVVSFSFGEVAAIARLACCL
jgi:hypothetical protein